MLQITSQTAASAERYCALGLALKDKAVAGFENSSPPKNEHNLSNMII